MSPTHGADWRGVRFADREVTLVAAAGSPKTFRIGDTEIESRALVSCGIAEIDADAVFAGRYVEGNFKISLVLCAGNISAEDYVRGRIAIRDLRLCSRTQGHAQNCSETHPSRSLPDVQQYPSHAYKPGTMS